MASNFFGSIASLARDSISGQALYYISGRKLARPVYLRPGYEIPEKYLAKGVYDNTQEQLSNSSSELDPVDEIKEEAHEAADGGLDPKQLEKEAIQDGDIIVDWEGPDDPEKPTNWSLTRKLIATAILCVLTTSVYMATAIFTPAEAKIKAHFGCSEVELMLGLTLFVWGYGIGPMIFSTMSENPAFGGRLYIFIFAQIVFIALQIPTALANHVSSFAVLRFLAGLFAAPPLTNAGAALGDMYGFPGVVWAYIAWSVGAIAGPFIGPLIGGALVDKNSWRWAFWYTLIQAGGVFLFMVFLLPETSEQALLMRKARYLRRLTGNSKIVAPGDLINQSQKWGQIVKDVTLMPINLMLHEPVLLLINVHLSLVYAVLYLYFEAFPMVFNGIYGFTLVEQGAAYLALLVGCVLAGIAYVPYLRKKLVQPMLRGEFPTPEQVFVPVTIIGSALIPIGILIFAWAATKSSHWIGPLIGVALFAIGTWILFQTYISYLGQMYPTRFASAMASNTLMRCLVGGAFPLFGIHLYENTATHRWPVGWGCSIIAFIAIPLILLPVYLRIKGEGLRNHALEKYGAKLQR